MDELQLLLDTIAAPLATSHGRAMTLVGLLALPFVAVFFARSVWLAALFVASAAAPAWMLAIHHVDSSLALWLGLTWLATILLCVLASMRSAQHQNAMSMMSRIAHIDLRVETFLDALDRRAALIQDLTRAEPAPSTPRPAPAPAEREFAD